MDSRATITVSAIGGYIYFICAHPKPKSQFVIDIINISTNKSLRVTSNIDVIYTNGEYLFVSNRRHEPKTEVYDCDFEKVFEFNLTLANCENNRVWVFRENDGKNTVYYGVDERKIILSTPDTFYCWKNDVSIEATSTVNRQKTIFRKFIRSAPLENPNKKLDEKKSHWKSNMMLLEGNAQSTDIDSKSCTWELAKKFNQAHIQELILSNINENTTSVPTGIIHDVLGGIKWVKYHGQVMDWILQSRTIRDIETSFEKDAVIMLLKHKLQKVSAAKK